MRQLKSGAVRQYANAAHGAHRTTSHDEDGDGATRGEGEGGSHAGWQTGTNDAVCDGDFNPAQDSKDSRKVGKEEGRLTGKCDDFEFESFESVR